MKKKATLFLAIVGLALGLGTSAAGLGVCSYVSPETNLTDLGLSFAYHYFDDWATPGVDTSGGRAGLEFNHLYDSPDFGFTLTANAELLLTDFFPVSGLGDAAGTFRYYFSQDMPAFGFGGLEASVASGQPQPAVHVSAGLGYGRFSDVTPLAKAFKIEAELLKADAIRQALGDDVLMGIASSIGSYFATSEEQIADVVKQIQVASGVTLSPRQVLNVEDLVLATDDTRHCGWSVQAGVGYQLVDPYNQPQGFLLTASADAAFVPNPDGQLLLHAGLSGPLDIMNQNTFTARASYAYAMSETSSLLATYTLLRVQPLGLPVGMSQTAALFLGFAVGRADMGLQASLSKSAGAPAWKLDISVSAAISLDL